MKSSDDYDQCFMPSTLYSLPTNKNKIKMYKRRTASSISSLA